VAGITRSIRKLNTGEVLSVKGHQVEALYIILSGRLALFVDRGAGPNKVIEWREEMLPACCRIRGS
jgi:CRP-like cAMP-binding protein